jgi:endonuclease YncB( thermonuclease family)
MYQYTAWGLPSTRDPLGVVDGDTVNVGVDLGMEVAINISLRLYGINAPEMSTQAGKDAKSWAIDWFQQHCPHGSFTVNTLKDKTEKYGRYLATVTAPDGHVFNEDIVAAGHAVSYFPKLPFDHDEVAEE